MSAEQEFKKRIVAEEVDFIVPNLAFGDFILDLGCGDGYHSLDLMDRGFSHVFSLDRRMRLSKETAFSIARFDGRPSFIEGTWDQLPFGDSTMDCVFMIHNGDGFKPRKFAEVNRVLKTNGKFIFDAPVWEDQHQVPFTIENGLNVLIDHDLVIPEGWPSYGDRTHVKMVLDPVNHLETRVTSHYQDNKLVRSRTVQRLILSLPEYHALLPQFGFLYSDLKTIDSMRTFEVIKQKEFV